MLEKLLTFFLSTFFFQFLYALVGTDSRSTEKKCFFFAKKRKKNPKKNIGTLLGIILKRIHNFFQF